MTGDEITTASRVGELLELVREANLTGPDATSWLARLSPLTAQLTDATGWLVEQGREPAAVELAPLAWRVWLLTGDVPGGRALLAAALDSGTAPAPSTHRAQALYADGLLAFRAGAQADSQQRNEQALAVATAIGDPAAEALALVGLSRVAFRSGNYARVRELAAAARALTRDLEPAAGVAPLHMLAAGTRLAGNYDEAVALYAESLELNRRLGDLRMVGTELHNIGHVEVRRGDLAAAERCFTELAGVRNADDPYEVAMTSLNQAALAAARGEREAAVDLLRRTEETLGEVGIVLDPDDAFEVAWLREKLSRE
ncbi:MAG: hypothetical protein NVSMB13_02320 [Mycobacteriales bacterium]